MLWGASMAKRKKKPGPPTPVAAYQNILEQLERDRKRAEKVAARITHGGPLTSPRRRK